jgi:START domain
MTHRQPWPIIGLAFAACMSGAPAFANSAANADSAWQATGVSGAGREAIKTYAKSVPGMQVKAFRGETDVPHTVPEFLSLLADVNNLPAWVFNGKHAERPAGQPAGVVYMQFKGVWPTSDRDVLAKREVSQLADGSVLVETQQVAGYPEQAGHVRMPALRTTFKLTPLPSQWTHVAFETQVDVGGSIPSWLSNMVSTKAPRVTLEGVQAQLKKSKYQGKSLADLPDGIKPVGAAIKLPEEHLRP